MKTKLILLVSVAIFLGNTISAQPFKYIGAVKCKACHNVVTSGEQYNKWMKEPHSQAIKTLGNEKSWEYAKKNGIADPTKEAKCLKCHSTFHAIDPSLRMTITEAEGVSCESCHGGGSVYKAIPIMRDQAKALQSGLIIPDEKLCRTCHNKENPFDKGFDYKKSLPVVLHPIPATATH